MQKTTHIFHYNGTGINYDIWFTDQNVALSTVIFLGTIQTGKIPEWVASVCPPGTAIVQGAPHWFAKRDGSDVRDFVYDYSKDAFQNILDAKNVCNLKIIADSQSAPFLLRLLNDNKLSSAIERIVLVQPLGLNLRSYGFKEIERLRRFKQRFLINSVLQLPYFFIDSRLRYNHHQLYKSISPDQEKADFQYAAGLAHDALDDLEQAYKSGFDISIVCGSKDKVFPPSEIRESIESRNLNIRITEVPGVPHSSLPTRQGLRLLKAALI